jgi:hypothetical protein
MADIDEYWRGGFHDVEGWVFVELVDYLKCIAHFQREAKIAGNIAEIGVHHGKLLIALSHFANPAEKCVALDVFENQAANIDGSGRGHLVKFRENVDRFAPPGVEFIVVQADSLALTEVERFEIGHKHGPFRIFSVDGGHTVEHTLNDVKLAQSMLADGGVVMLDDYYNQHWPGVHEGVGLFYAHGSPRIKPFMYAHNKLFFSGIAYHERYLHWCSDTFRNRRGFRIVRMYNADTMVVA